MRVLFVATVVKTHIMEFHLPYLKMCKEKGWHTAVAARNDFDDSETCVIPGCDAYYDIPFERNPFSTGNIQAYKRLRNVIEEGHYDLIHCHTPVGGVLTRLAARKARRRGCKVIYTAHGFHFYKGGPRISWLLYYPVERMLAHLTDVLITINREDYSRAKKFKAGRVVYIPGVGIDLSKFNSTSVFKDRDIRKELGLPSDARILLSVGELNQNKNHQLMIRALADIPGVYYVICGRGELQGDLERLAESCSVADRVVFAGYRTDLPAFYRCADVFVFPSYREGLPVALMEAMASGLVCVASRNRGTEDLLQESSYRFDADDISELTAMVRKALSEDNSEEIERNLRTLRAYDIENTLAATSRLYEEMLSAEDQPKGRQ